MLVNHQEEIKCETHNPVTVLHLSGACGSLEEPGRSCLRIEELKQFADRHRPHILLNFRSVQAHAVRGLELTPFMKLAVWVRQQNGRIAACHLPVSMQEIFEVAHLDRVVAVYVDQEQAIKEMLRPPSIYD